MNCTGIYPARNNRPWKKRNSNEKEERKKVTLQIDNKFGEKIRRKTKKKNTSEKQQQTKHKTNEQESAQ